MAAEGQARAAVAAIEAFGYGSLRLGETPAIGREAFTQAGFALSATRRLTVATGVANIWLRVPAAAAAAANTLAEAYPGRFILGLGASHAEVVSAVGGQCVQPLSAMRAYLDALRALPPMSPAAVQRPTLVLGALRPRMQRLAATHADGAQTFFGTPSHTAAVRQRIGDNAILVVQQAVAVDDDPVTARRRSRDYVTARLRLTNYYAHAAELGFSEGDLRGTHGDDPSDAVVTAFTASNLEQAALRVGEHLSAGADHVVVNALSSPEDPLGLRQLERLGEVLHLRAEPPDSAGGHRRRPARAASAPVSAQTP
jgi:probable F420-dependent oxidoreductase